MVKIQIFMGTLCGKKLCMFPNICREQKWQTNKHIFTNEYETLGFIWKTDLSNSRSGRERERKRGREWEGTGREEDGGRGKEKGRREGEEERGGEGRTEREREREGETGRKRDWVCVWACTWEWECMCTWDRPLLRILPSMMGRQYLASSCCWASSSRRWLFQMNRTSPCIRQSIFKKIKQNIT